MACGVRPRAGMHIRLALMQFRAECKLASSVVLRIWMGYLLKHGSSMVKVDGCEEVVISVLLRRLTPGESNSFEGRIELTEKMSTEQLRYTHYSRARNAFPPLVQSSKLDGGGPGSLRRCQNIKEFGVEVDDAVSSCSELCELSLGISLGVNE